MHRLTRACLARPGAALILLAVGTAVFGLGLPRVHPEFGYRVLIGDDHPAVRRLDAFIARFGGGLPIQIGWACGPGLPCRSVFDRDSLAMAHAVTTALQSEAGVHEVIGPANAPLLVPQDDGFAVRRLVENGRIANDASRLAQRAGEDPLWRGALVDSAGTAATLVVQPVDSTPRTSARVSAAVRRVLEPFEAAGFHFHLTGDPIQNGIVGRELAESTSRLIPFTVLVIGLILYGLSRSLQVTAVALTTLGVALVWTFGLLGFLAWPQDGILEVLAPLVLVVGVCDSVHLLAEYHASLGIRDPARAARARALVRAARRIAGPCLLTTLTTAAAFLSFVTSDLATFVRFGAIAAFGVLACLLLTFSLLPLLVLLLPHRDARAAVSRTWSVALESVLRTSERRAVPILVIAGIVLAVCAAGWALHLRVDHQWTESLGEDSQVVRSWRFMEERIGRSDTLEVEVVPAPGTPIEDPRSLAAVAALADFLGGLENLREPRSVVDIVRRVNRLLHGDRAEHERIGATTGANAEILELVGLDDPVLLASWLSFDRRRLRISVGAPEQAFSTRKRVMQGLADYAATHLPDGWQALPTGRVAMQFAWIRDVQATQLRSFPTALVLVGVMLAVFLRSGRLALAALVPSVLPVVVTLGTMGWVGMTLDVGRAMIAAVVLGIAVDDSIHILHRYRTRRLEGDEPRRAIREAIQHTGRAVVTTSLALALGFLTLMASAWQSIASFGFFVALAILGALLASLFVLPALIFAFSRDREASSERKRSGRTRRLASLAVVLPVVAASASAIAWTVTDGSRWQAPCWLLPRAHVLKLPGAGRCPLELLDQIRWVQDGDGRRRTVSGATDARAAIEAAGPDPTLGVLRRGQERSVVLRLEPSTRLQRAGGTATGVALAWGLLLLPVLLLLNSRARAALPLAIFYSATGVVLIAALASPPSQLLSAASVAALLVAPAALAQLCMLFPVESRIVRQAPRLVWAPYLASAGLAATAFLVLDRAPLLWPTFVYLLLGLCGGAWLVLMLACAFSVREAASSVGRARARFVFFSSLALPAALALPLTWDDSPSQMAAAYLWCSSLVVPLPIGFAISRYNLFDLGWHARRASARVVYFLAGALGVAGSMHLAVRALDPTRPPRDFGTLFLTALGCMVAAEGLRRPILGWLESTLSPRLEALRALRERSSRRMASLSGEHEISRRLLRTLQAGIRFSSAWVVFERTGAWEPAQSIGDVAPAAPAAMQQAALLVHDRDVVDLSSREPGDPSPLADHGIHVVASLRHGEEMLGLVLLGAPARNAALAGCELDFVAGVCAQAAIAIHNSRAADERAAVERHAATARVAVDLMQDVGKDLGWMRGLAARLAARAQHEPGLQAAACQVRDLADSVAGRLRAFARDAASRGDDPPGTERLDELLERCVRALCSRHGKQRVRLRHEPVARGVRCHENVGRVLLHLVEHAIRDTHPRQTVEISTDLDADGWLNLRVETDGGPAAVARSFELALSCDMAEALGGSIELSVPAAGRRRANLHLPLAEHPRLV